MFSYNSVGKVLVPVVSVACSVAQRKSSLPWSTVLQPVKLTPTSEIISAMQVDSYREELDINRVLKTSLRNGLCHNFKTLVSGCKLTTGNLKTREEIGQCML